MALLVLAGTLLLEPIWAVLLGVAASVVHLVRRVSFRTGRRWGVVAT